MKGAKPPFQEYWGGYSPPSPPGSDAYDLVEVKQLMGPTDNAGIIRRLHRFDDSICSRGEVAKGSHMQLLPHELTTTSRVGSCNFPHDYALYNYLWAHYIVAIVCHGSVRSLFSACL